jgi:hypothetical protein
VNGDGTQEFITGAGPGGGPHVRLWNVVGGSLTELTGFMAGAFTAGVSVACGDVTGDATDEVITAQGFGGSPQVQVWSLQGGNMVALAQFFAYTPAFIGGVTVAVGDVTGDGVNEIITGAGPGGGPHVRIWNVAGGTVSELAGFFAYEPAFAGGVNIAVGDVTGDGVAEIITGADRGGGPHVRVFSATPTLVEVTGFFAYDPAFPGGVRIAR